MQTRGRFPPRFWSHATDSLEQSGKVVDVSDSAAQCDIFDRNIGIGKQCFGMVDAVMIDIVCQRSSHFFGEQCGQITCIDTKMLCQRVQSQIGRQIRFQVGDNFPDDRGMNLVLVFLDDPAVSECDGLLCTQALSCGSQTFQHGYIAVGIGVNMDRMYTSLFGCFSK